MSSQDNRLRLFLLVEDSVLKPSRLKSLQCEESIGFLHGLRGVDNFFEHNMQRRGPLRRYELSTRTARYQEARVEGRKCRLRTSGR